MTGREELLAALQAERYDNRWWNTPAKIVDDSEVTCARRRRAAIDETKAAADTRQRDRWRADIRRIRRSA